MLDPHDGQELCDEYELFKRFTAAWPPFDIAAPPPRVRERLEGNWKEPPRFKPHQITFAARLLSLEGAWIDCKATSLGGPLMIEPADATGAALGVISMNNVATWQAVACIGTNF